MDKNTKIYIYIYQNMLSKRMEEKGEKRKEIVIEVCIQDI